jgi:predicted helicase
MTIEEYLSSLNTRYKTGISTEHTYRGDLQNLLESLLPGFLVTNEPSRVACGAPDYILTRKNIPIGYIEAKDLGANLGDKLYKEQFDRYKASLPNLIFTNYLDFWFFREGVLVKTITIGRIEKGKVFGNPLKYSEFTDLIVNFSTFVGQTIRSAEKLAKMMAGKARMLATVIENAITSDEVRDDQVVYDSANNSLKDQLTAFKDVLIHDIKPKEFADIYAQTITYGMFAARLHDPTLDTFSRVEAAQLIPKTNPFLRKLFQYVAGYDLDARIKWIVDDLADIFRATDVADLLKDFGKSTQQTDPIIHFYETFLGEFDPKLRKARGVWYTPEPVVNFIVRAVDDILKTEFGLPQGLADTSKTIIKQKVWTNVIVNKKSITKEIEVDQEVHKVQILDPAAGTGTFLAEVIRQVYKKFEGQQGIWSKYVDDHLIPRLNGFELLMASYAMAHLKLDMLLKETGYKPTKDQRFRIYLTNSLEEHHPDTGTLFANWISTEANEANYIKRDTPVMVIIGNPPYSGVSTNNGDWITRLIEDYKYINGEHFKEKKHWLQDDYVKFIRLSQHFIEKNGEGILAFVNNHSFIDNPTFRGMRWQLLNSFDSLYILDLHGNSKKKEICPDGTKDWNVFDIQAGVSINIFIKKGKKPKGELGKLKYAELWGTREHKYKSLWENSLRSIEFKEIDVDSQFYFFNPRDFKENISYSTGFNVSELFPNNITGIVTMGDSFILDDNKEILLNRLNDFISSDLSAQALTDLYGLGKNYAEWILQNKAIIKLKPENFLKIDYRPFDEKWTYFDNKLIWRWRIDTMRHFLKGENIGLVIPKINKEDDCFFITKHIIAHKICSAYDSNSVFPLYLYPENVDKNDFENIETRCPNLNLVIVEKIATSIDHTFYYERKNIPNTLAPLDILDYIYAILYSPTYREKFKAFLKIDFPRVPYPKDPTTFWSLVKLGGELRQIHLLESPVFNLFLTTYPVDGTNQVCKIHFENGKVWINDEQYFDHVPQIAWDFYIGGYQPAQKWLKDRKGRTLTFEDILHYQKIIVALAETDRLMTEIDQINFMN